MQQWNLSHPPTHSGGSLKPFLQQAALGPQNELQLPPLWHPADQHSFPRFVIPGSVR